MLEVGLAVPVDLLVGEDPPFGRAPRGVADPGRVVADDQDADVAGALERRHSLQRNRVTHVDLRRGDVDAELDPERPPDCELPFELAFREYVDGVAGQLRELVSVPHRRPMIEPGPR